MNKLDQVMEVVCEDCRFRIKFGGEGGCGELCETCMIRDQIAAILDATDVTDNQMKKEGI